MCMFKPSRRLRAAIRESERVKDKAMMVKGIAGRPAESRTERVCDGVRPNERVRVVALYIYIYMYT